MHGSLTRTLFTLVFAVMLVLAAWPSAGRAGEPGQGPGLVRGPYLQLLRSDGVDVFWTIGEEIGEPGDVEGQAGRVVFNESDEPRVTALESPDVVCPEPLLEGERCYRVRLRGLTSDTEYRYRLLVGERELAAGREFRFRTIPAAGTGVVHLAALGDSGVAVGAQLEVAATLDAIAARELFHGILHTGDMDYRSGGDRLLFDATIFGPYADLLSSSCLFPTHGNHDIVYQLDRLFTPPGLDPGLVYDSDGFYYSFDWGSAHVVFVDTTLRFESGAPGGALIEWLCGDLGGVDRSQQRWIIAVTHEPLFTIGIQTVGSERHRHALAPIFDEFDVDLVLSGDDHNYQRSHPLRMLGNRSCGNFDPLPCDATPVLCYELADGSGPHFAAPDGTIYVVTGGGGNVLYPEAPLDRFPDRAHSSVFVYAHHAVELHVSPATLAVRAVDVEGREIDSFSINKLRLLRGDLDFNGQLEITDAVVILEGLFLGRPVDCLAAGNVNGDAIINIADPISLLNYLFLGGPPPAAPFPQCGPLPEAIELLDGLVEPFCSRIGC